MEDHHVFAGNPLDRGDRQRRDPAWLIEQAGHERSKFLPLWRLNVPIGGAHSARLAWLDVKRLRNAGVRAEPVLLGIRDGVSHFAIDVSELDDGASALDQDPEVRFEEVRAAAALLGPAEAAIAAQARAQVDWHARHGYCGVCGHRTEQTRGGQVRKCPSCGSEHFPRTDPVVIVVVGDGDRCLLGQSRGRLSRMGMYSALAGFVDQGESIEEAVRREVAEEAGVAVGRVRYHSSQPWPFPSSLMIGCHADAQTTEINPDPEEMSDVNWFSREAVRLALLERNPELRVPAPLAIAHHLIKAWADGDV